MKYLLALLPSLALATDPPMSTPVTLPDVIATSEATATQQQNAISSTSQSQATTNQNSTSAAATNAGNAQSVEFKDVRQAPGIAQGSLLVTGCGAGANAGGSNTGGSGFLGITFTPYECHLARHADAYDAAGDHLTACEIRRRSPSMQRLKRETGFEPPSCQVPSAVSVSPPSVGGIARGEASVVHPAEASSSPAAGADHAARVEEQKAQTRSGK